MNTKTIPLAFLICAAILPVSCCRAPNGPAPFATGSSIAGGYSATEITGEVKEAAQFAVRTQSKSEPHPLKLTGISRAEQQVVAGLNYHLLLTVTQAGKSRSAEAVVYRSLNSRYELTSWRWLSK